MRCDGAALAFAGFDDEGAPRPHLARHLARCLRCQADRAHDRRLRHLLAQLRADQVALGPGMLASVLDAIGAAAAEQAADVHEAGHGRRLSASLAAGGLALAAALAAGLARFARQGEAASQCYR